MGQLGRLPTLARRRPLFSSILSLPPSETAAGKLTRRQGRWRRGLHRPFAEIWIHGAAAPAGSAPLFALWTVCAGTLPGVLDCSGGGESALGGGSSGAFVLARSGGVLLPPSRSFPFALVAGGCCWFRCFWGWWCRLGPGETLGRLVRLDSGVGFGRRILPEGGVGPYSCHLRSSPG